MSTGNGRPFLQFDLNFVSHRKVKRVARALSIESVQVVGHLVSLITAVASQIDRGSAQAGTLPDWRNDDIAAEAQWSGEADPFVDALIDAGWLDNAGDGVLAVHDWAENQPYFAKGAERSLQAQKAAYARWKKPDAPSMRAASTPHPASKPDGSAEDADEVRRDARGEESKKERREDPPSSSLGDPPLRA